MATRKQRAANRRNAQLSTGPKNPEGKAAVRLNALKHGLCAENAVISLEDAEAFHELLNHFRDDLQPVGTLETALVDQTVIAQWRLARCRKLETSFFELRLIDQEEDPEPQYTGLNNNQRLAQVFSEDACPAPSVLESLSRYEARNERAFYRALHELQRLQAARQTNSVEQTQTAPETHPNPLPQNDLTPSSAGASSRPEPLLRRIPPGPARQSIRAWAPRVASAPAR